MANRNSFSSLGDLRSLSITPGAVFLGPWAGVDHEKFLIVAGVEENRFLICSVMINSQINQYILKRPRLLACQVELKGKDYDFLSHDSYANCAQPIKAKRELFMVDELKYCGLLNDSDLLQVQQQIISSGSLTAEEIAMFFGLSEY
jgi:hypothetical protein